MFTQTEQVSGNFYNFSNTAALLLVKLFGERVHLLIISARLHIFISCVLSKTDKFYSIYL